MQRHVGDHDSLDGVHPDAEVAERAKD